MLTAEDIIEQARDFSALFTRQAVPDITALKALSRFQKELAAAVVQENPDALGVWHEILPADFPADLEDGILLPAHILAMGAEVISALPETLPVEVAITSPGQAKTQPQLYPSVSIMNGRLYLTDLRYWYGTEHGWEDVARIRVRLVPEIEELVGLSTPITLPDSAEAALVANLALWMADRVGAKLSTLREQAAGSAGAWVTSILNMSSTSTWMVEVVE